MIFIESKTQITSLKIKKMFILNTIKQKMLKLNCGGFMIWMRKIKKLIVQ